MTRLTAQFVVTDDTAPRLYLDEETGAGRIRLSDGLVIVLDNLTDPVAFLRRLSVDADELSDEIVLRSIEAEGARP